MKKILYAVLIILFGGIIFFAFSVKAEAQGVFLCDDEQCQFDPPLPPWRKTTVSINNICNTTPSAADSEPDGDKICGEVGSIRIAGPYDVRLYENNDYGGKKICFRDEGWYKLDNYPIVPGNGWNKDTDSVEILADGACTNPGVTEEAGVPPGGPIIIEIKNPLNATSFEALINSIINFIFWIALAIAPLMLIIAGFYFVTAAGDPKKVETAKGIILYTLIGLLIIFLAKGFIAFLRQVL